MFHSLGGESCLTAAPHGFFEHALQANAGAGLPWFVVWPLYGVVIGATFRREVYGEMTSDEQTTVDNWLRLASLFGGAALTARLRRTPHSRRLRAEIAWPGMHLATPDEKLLRKLQVSDRDIAAIRMKGIFEQLRRSNTDVEEFRQDWTLSVLDGSIAGLLCFVIPSTRAIWISDTLVHLLREESRLAYVLGHEVSHVICDHQKDAFSAELLAQFGLFFTGALIGWFLSDPSSPPSGGVRRVARFVKNGVLAVAACAGAVLSLHFLFALPYWRKLEREADIVGLKFAAKAGFDVEEIPDAMTVAPDAPSWRSTHPSSPSRARLLASLLPWARLVVSGRPPLPGREAMPVEAEGSGRRGKSRRWGARRF